MSIPMLSYNFKKKKNPYLNCWLVQLYLQLLRRFYQIKLEWASLNPFDGEPLANFWLEGEEGEEKSNLYFSPIFIVWLIINYKNLIPIRI